MSFLNYRNWITVVGLLIETIQLVIFPFVQIEMASSSEGLNVHSAMAGIVYRSNFLTFS